MKKLSGIRVLDLSQFLPGPMLTVMMADQGAEVIKIEPPTGDPARDMAPFENGQSVWFRSTNRGKKSLMLDLKTAEDCAHLLTLVETADVFVESFRPGVMARLGFDYATLQKINPKLVYCSISAFGQHNPWADHPAHDMAVQALGGFLSVNDTQDGTPVVPGVPAADMAVCLTGLSAVLMALFAAQKTGMGDYIDCAMLDSLMPWCVHIAGPALLGGDAPKSSEQRSLGGAAFYNIYKTADNKFITLAGRELKFVRALLTALERPDLISLGEAPAGTAQAPLKEFLEITFKTRSRDAWIAWFADKDVAFAPALDFAESFIHPAVSHCRTRDANGNIQLSPAIRFTSENVSPLPSAPELNAGAK
jgi:crotonobetainyl-CoA:carnitine CoA-transferase CaiB-like acyl-CoA transferase